MNAKKCAAVAALSFSLTVACAGPGQTQAQDDKNKYPNMAPLNQYMMERDAEIARCVQHPKSRLLSSDYVTGVVACRFFQSSASSLMATASASNTDFAS
jgi:hypothetical protein